LMVTKRQAFSPSPGGTSSVFAFPGINQPQWLTVHRKFSTGSTPESVQVTALPMSTHLSNNVICSTIWAVKSWGQDTGHQRSAVDLKSACLSPVCLQSYWNNELELVDLEDSHKVFIQMMYDVTLCLDQKVGMDLCLCSFASGYRTLGVGCGLALMDCVTLGSQCNLSVLLNIIYINGDLKVVIKMKPATVWKVSGCCWNRISINVAIIVKICIVQMSIIAYN
jgi:hypothetical protein